MKIYEATVKDVPTERFTEYLEKVGKFTSKMLSYSNMGKGNIGDKAAVQSPIEDDTPSSIPFDPNASYVDLDTPIAILPKKPKLIPGLDFADLPEYEVTSDEEENFSEKSCE